MFYRKFDLRSDRANLTFLQLYIEPEPLYTNRILTKLICPLQCSFPLKKIPKLVTLQDGQP